MPPRRSRARRAATSCSKATFRACRSPSFASIWNVTVLCAQLLTVFLTVFFPFTWTQVLTTACLCFFALVVFFFAGACAVGVVAPAAGVAEALPVDQPALLSMEACVAAACAGGKIEA